MEWYHYVIGVIVLLIVRDLLAWLLGWGGSESGESTRDPEGGTIGKMFNWHKRERIHTLPFDPYPTERNKGPWKPNGDGTYQKPATGTGAKGRR
jgi:hypothetical protein